MSAEETIAIHGAREHNLKNISLEIPRNRFVVVTGVSGSGKSTLAFDLIFAEGQRRFLDSMNVYARQFVEQLSRPEVDLITGIPPTVSIEQRTSRGGGKSTVATVTEIYHFLRLLFARTGTQHCPDCGLAVQPQTRDELSRRLVKDARVRGKLHLLAPVVKSRKGFHTDVAEWAAKHGYATLRADGKLYSTSEPLRLDRFREHDVELVIGTITDRGRPLPAAGSDTNSRIGVGPFRRKGRILGTDSGIHYSLQDLVAETLKVGAGTLLALDDAGGVTIHSTERACPRCGRSFEPLDPKNFSYNSPRGWCPECRGFGETFFLPDVDRGARADAIEESWFDWQEGKREPCSECGGARINKLARAVSWLPSVVSGYKSQPPTIESISAMGVDECGRFFDRLKFHGSAAEIVRDLLPEIRERLRFLSEVGLGYLQLGRGVPTLSGGEAQRIRLAAQLGSNLSGVLYVLDEPTIGLHARDNLQLLSALEKLKARGNSILVVEHDEETMRRADHVIDLGPGAGIHGGEVVASGTLGELMKHPESVTGRCLRSHKAYPTRGERRFVSELGNRSSAAPISGRDAPAGRPPNWLKLKDARRNNLQNLTVAFPLGRLVLITGVSGSGKSTLARECLLPALQEALRLRKSRHARRSAEGAQTDGFAVLSGAERIAAVYEVDQSPIGRTPRSVPATYVGFLDPIRQLFAQTPEARLRGYTPGRFSFNSPQGRCPECDGAGDIKLEMNFLPPAYVRCEVCDGTRYNRETLDITYGGKNICEILELTVEGALAFFDSVPQVKRPLQALCDTGLGYLKLGQTSPTLSGGEAQRVKLVTHLLSGLRPAPARVPSRSTPLQPDFFEPPRNGNLFILEEPTIGLHMADVQRLVEVLQRLVDAGHSVIVIEHNVELIAEADWVIDLGPEGGAGGGQLVAEGTPEQIVKVKRSHTGRFLSNLLRAAGSKGPQGKRR